jgi:hypothetical protein
MGIAEVNFAETKRDPEPSRASSKILRALEETYGGREGLIDKIAILDGESLSPAQRLLLEMVCDPANDRASLAQLCARAEISVPAFVAFTTQAFGAQALHSAQVSIFSDLPAVVRDAMGQGKIHNAPCPKCKGKGSVLKEGGGRRVHKRADGTEQISPTRPRTPIECPRCLGSGDRRVIPSAERVKIALGLGGLGPKAAKGTTVNVHASASAQAGALAGASVYPRSAIGKMLQAADRVQFKDRPAAAELAPGLGPEIIDLTPVAVSEAQAAAPAPALAAQPPAPLPPPPYRKPAGID